MIKHFNHQVVLTFKRAFVVCLAAVASTCGAAEAKVDPTKLEFKLLATRRFMLDNEVMLSEFVPGESARPSLQNPLMPYCAMYLYGPDP